MISASEDLYGLILIIRLSSQISISHSDDTTVPGPAQSENRKRITPHPHTGLRMGGLFIDGTVHWTVPQVSEKITVGWENKGGKS